MPATRTFVLALLLTILRPVTSFGQDLDQGETWLRIKPLLFGDRPIQSNADKVLQLFVPQRAEDASVVPVLVIARILQTPDRQIRHIWLVIDENPSPFGGKFTFTQASGRAHIETRVRLESSSPVRAIAELSDGTLWMQSGLVIGAGGCSAPVGKSGVLGSLGRMKLRIEDEFAEPGEPVQAQLLINHPQFSGMASNAQLEPRFVRELNVYHGDALVMRAEVDFTISENPSFHFYFLPRPEAPLRAEVIDSSEQRFVHSIAVRAR
jgi:sulfur-oxidizing protein SoxY